MSQGSNTLRRDQGISSSASDAIQPRRRIEDESNWLDAGSSDDYESTSDDSSDNASQPGTQTLPPRTSSRVPYSWPVSPSVNMEQGRPAEHWRGRPLIDRVTNEWQQRGADEKKEFASQRGYMPPNRRRAPSPDNCFDEMCDAGSAMDCLGIIWSRTSARIIVAWLLVFICLYTVRGWLMKTTDRSTQNGALRNAVVLKMSGGQPRGAVRGQGKTWYGAQHETDFNGMLGISGIRDQDWSWADGHRMIIIGDVHGCSAPLKQLLEKVKFDNGRDHLVFTGDLVAKGPDTAGVLDMAISYNASSVRGNHDDKLLLLRSNLDGPLKAIQSATGKPMTGAETHRKERDLAASLSTEHIEYLSQCPLILDLGAIPSLAPQAFVAHAGMVPGLDLAKQDPSAVMNMRSIDIRTHTPSRAHAPEVERALKAQLGDEFKELPPPWNNKKNKQRMILDLNDKYVMPWTRLWEEWQKYSKKDDRALIVYGHDSAMGLVNGPWAIGIDTGCVKGGELTALVLKMKGGKVAKSLESVQCKDETKKSKKA